ncbi:MAG: DUF349 domain-containing protein [Bacteroidales bacterium]|nr:DUF349 domain-containing protein [Bacteroidales bacterium]
MSEIIQPAMPEEQNTASTLEQAINAATQEEVVTEATSTEPTTDAPAQITRKEIIERLKEIAGSDDALNYKSETDALKIQFYKLRSIEAEAARKAEDEESESPATPVADELEEQFKEVMNIIKEKRNAWLQQQAAEQQANYETKLAILEELKEMVIKAEQGSPSVNDFKNLQTRWREIKNIPQEKANDLWKQYQQLTEQFYDMLKLNIEFREYDFKKNLEIKTRICEAAEALIAENDIVSASRQLQQLHIEFREAGPVSPELRESIWTRFKTASTTINKRHQQHFEEKKEKERENLEKKTAICEAIEQIPFDTLTTYQQWNDKTQEVLDLQVKWREIGFAPQKMNQKIFERFRAACDEFFSRKSEFFKNVKTSLTENLEKKRKLCEAAEQLKESEDWKETAEKFTALQKEWKSIGAIPQKYSDALWKRFIGACDYFFERRNKATSSQRSVELENLKLKREIIERLKAITAETATEEQEATLAELTKEWNKIGHVPFRDKDKLYKEYKQTIDAIYERLHISANERRLTEFRNNISKGGENLSRERERLIRQHEAMKAEIKTYENNIGFLSASNKKGASIVDAMLQRVEKIKAEAEIVLKKIKLIEDEMGK